MVGWKRWSWALAGAFALHNTEEALTMRRFPSLAGWLDQAGRLDQGALNGLMAAISGLGVVAVAVGTTGRPAAWKPYLPAGMAGVMLLNVALPHVPAAVAARGYAPGLVTALGLNLPIGAAVLRSAVREGAISRRGLRRTMPVALGVLACAPLAVAAARAVSVGGRR
ncbi:HXXEE domain-containing protein [Actinoallomurus sp. NPDC050550]|uniref:HXXEE domain-containing protein n=1 Tax=Actinoallomurus sp. NPDC050550 TaxID=3154937 RepID=UPI0033EF6DDA